MRGLCRFAAARSLCSDGGRRSVLSGKARRRVATGTASLEWLQTLADTTRVRLLRLLESHELSVSELCAILQAPQSTVSRHLKVLAAEGWTASRRDGTTRLYRAAVAQWDGSRRELWCWVRERISELTTDLDGQRLQQVLASRRRSDLFFSSSADEWDQVRVGLFGSHVDACALSAALPDGAVVGELGCGSAPLAQTIAPFVHRVYAVDNSPAMLNAASRKLAAHANVECVLSSLTAIELPDHLLDAAWMVLVLPYLEAPTDALREAARILKRRRPLVILDILPHDRTAYCQEMGHLRQGVSQSELTRWLADAGVTMQRFVELPTASNAAGPALFVARAEKR